MRAITDNGGPVQKITGIADLRALARRKIPRPLFEYVDRGSYDEITLRRNRADLDAVCLRQRVGVDVSNLSLSTTLLGQNAALPVAIAPTGLTGLFRKDGEIIGARAALAAGIPFCLSTMSICSIEDVRASVQQPFWFQLYFMKDRGFNRELIARAQAAACPVLVLTMDVAVIALRRSEVKHGLTIPPRLTPTTLFNMISKPGWLMSVLLGRRRTFGNLASRVSGQGVASLARWISSQCDPSVSWSDVEWLRSQWPGKLVLKGILDPEDARRACAAGADAVVVSNHGGRQLDGAPSSICMLGRIADAVDSRCEVLLDGGVQSGKDVLKALAHGARGCLIGRAYLYGLAAMGEVGVRLALNLIRDELAVTMALSGLDDVTRVDRSALVQS